MTWERKLVPLPFSTVTATYGRPIRVTEGTREACRRAIAEHLDGAAA